MKVLVLYDRKGKILAMIKIGKIDKSHPEIGIIPEKGNKVSEIEIPNNLSKLSLLDIHEKCKISMKKGNPFLEQRKTSSKSKK